MQGLDGKTALVTGGGGGIGTEICKRLALEGSKVFVLDINTDTAEATAARIRERGGDAFGMGLDITDYEACKALVAEVASQGCIDILINNAGWDKAIPFLETSPELWRKVIDINYLGPLQLLHTVLPHMIEQGSGKVVNISSDAGRVGSSGEAVYAGCKAGIVALGKSVARELARSGICINAVCPGPTDTALLAEFAGDGEYGQRIREGLQRAIPMRRLGQPEDVAGIVTFLASEEAGFITGQVISVSGGLTMHG